MFEVTKELSERIRAFIAVRQPALATVNASAKMWCPNTCQTNCVGTCKGTCTKNCSMKVK